jgi:hypothetical protein
MGQVFLSRCAGTSHAHPPGSRSKGFWITRPSMPLSVGPVAPPGLPFAPLPPFDVPPAPPPFGAPASPAPSGPGPPSTGATPLSGVPLVPPVPVAGPHTPLSQTPPSHGEPFRLGASAPQNPLPVQID